MDKLIKESAIRRAVKLLQKLKDSGDPEVAHGEADDILLDLIGDKRINKAYDEVPKYYA